MYARRIILTLAAGFMLVGCSSPIDPPVPGAPTANALANIREDAPSLRNASDEDLMKLMVLSCDLIETQGLEGFAGLITESNYDARDLGVLARESVIAVCPEHSYLFGENK